ncbi:FAD-dependent oxidoreductase [Pseudonocardia autotrophica]|uniref:FAD-dependent oxidoreductase n=1 Tax=Pseudonocardia autotrophica TaxID=2074 RepID=UPI0014152A5D|nr:FAD-dependent oxidoreductase [Pseudonocardia autotrophica]
MTGGPVDDEYDLICVGSGIGGCAAAAAAADAGARALVVERAQVVGGVTAVSGGQIWIPGNRWARALGMSDTAEEGARYIDGVAGGNNDPARTRALLGAADGALDLFTGRGLDLRVIRDLPDYYYPEAGHSAAEGRYLEPVPLPAGALGEWAGRLRRTAVWNMGAGTPGGGTADPELVTGQALAGYFVRAALDAGARLTAGTAVTRLRTRDGAVTGVVLADGREIVARSGVVLATGAYDRNPDLVRRFEGVLDDHGTGSPPGITGDHLGMAAPLGASIWSLPAARNTVQVGFPTGELDEDGTARYRTHWVVHPHEIIVNARGARFADESFYPAINAGLHQFDGASQRLPNWPAWLVFDHDLAERGVVQVDPERVVSAPSVEELARRAGIDADGLAATVAGYNEARARGRDDAFGRGERPWSLWMSRLATGTGDGNPTLGPIVRPPFHAARLARVQAGLGSAGLEVDTSARVLTWAGEPIPGLYAVGNATARNDMGFSAQSGTSNLRGMVQGYLAGRDAAR